jgi:prepilin-type N-terminal cleavage/methylation domain-containing protein
MKQVKIKRSERGFSLIEVLFAVVVFTLVAYALTAMLFSRTLVTERLMASKAAVDSADNALNALTSQPYASLSVGGSFTVIDEGSIGLQSCTEQTCDFIIEPVTAPEESPARGVKWQSGYTPPDGARIVYLRRFRIEDVDAELGLRRLTVAVLTDENADKPLIMQSTIVGDR